MKPEEDSAYRLKTNQRLPKDYASTSTIRGPRACQRPGLLDYAQHQAMHTLPMLRGGP